MFMKKKYIVRSTRDFQDIIKTENVRKIKVSLSITKQIIYHMIAMEYL